MGEGAMSERTERRKKKKRISTVYPLNKIIDSITCLNRYKQSYYRYNHCSDDTNRGELMQDGKGG